MSINRVIVNSSPLIVLFRSQQAELLPQLFADILVPEGVFAEVTMAGEDDAAARQLPNVAWIQIVKVTSIVPEVAAWDLGKGESQVLSLVSTTTDGAAIVDDRAARRCAQTLNISTIGTGGLLVLAKRRGIISSISPGIQALQNAGLWLSETVVNLLKQQAGE
jgi:predicted nucleic acid-binding protein